ncbi:hypothetical protein D3C76_1833580 [compost metagenome]
MLLSGTRTYLLFGCIGSHGDFSANLTVDLHHHQLGVFDHSLLVGLRPGCGIHIAFTAQRLPQ